MKDITFKQVLDTNGNFQHLEVIQGDNVVTIKFGNTFAQGHHTYVWSVFKETVDRLADKVADEAGAIRHE